MLTDMNAMLDAVMLSMPITHRQTFHWHFQPFLLYPHDDNTEKKLQDYERLFNIELNMILHWDFPCHLDLQNHFEEECFTRVYGVQ